MLESVLILLPFCMAPIVCWFNPWHNTFDMLENPGKGSRRVALIYLLVDSSTERDGKLGLKINLLLIKDPHMDICVLAALEFAYIADY